MTVGAERALLVQPKRFCQAVMHLHVESRPGIHGDPEPWAFMLGSRRIEVVNILDRWIARDHSYFKVDGSDNSLYILRYTPDPPQWELTLFQAPEA